MQGGRLIGGDREFGKRKHTLIKHDIPRYVDTISRNMKTFVTFMKGTIAKKDTLFGPKFQLAFIIWAQMRPASTTKHFKESIVRLFIQEKFNRSFHVKNTCGSTVDEKACSGESITPKPKGNRCMGQKSKTSFNNMTMLTFYRAILLMCMWTC
jgi:hypothetical protein